jgi:hypothetical protein
MKRWEVFLPNFSKNQKYKVISVVGRKALLNMQYLAPNLSFKKGRLGASVAKPIRLEPTNKKQCLCKR